MSRKKLSSNFAKMAGSAAIAVASFVAQAPAQPLPHIYQRFECPVFGGEPITQLYKMGFVRALNDIRIENRMNSAYHCERRNHAMFTHGYNEGRACVHNSFARMSGNPVARVTLAVDTCFNRLFALYPNMR